MTIRIDKCLLSVHLIPFFSGHIKNRCDHRPHGKSFKLIVGLRFLSWSHLNRCDHSCDHHLTTCATCTKIVAFTGITIHRHPCSTALLVFTIGAGQRPAPYLSGGSARQTIPVPRSFDRGTLRKYRKYVIISFQHPISCHL